MNNTFNKIYAIVLLACIVTLLAALPSPAASTRVIDNKDTILLRGNVHPFARPEFDKGEAEPSLRMERMIFTLKRNPQKQAELDKFLAQQQDPLSANFHHWLTPSEFGSRFGLSPEDITAITGWLKSNSFVVDEVAKGRQWINFSGLVADVKRAFHTQIHNYLVKGKLHHANDRDPSIPRGLSDLVTGIVTLHDFPHKAMNTGPKPVPYYTSGSAHYLSPGDFATIYNLNTLYNDGINGGGQSIAIVGRTNPSTSSSDWATFRSTMGLPLNPPQILVNGPDPGEQGIDEDLEANLDVEWSGAVAKNASILFVASRTTYTTDGVDLSSQYVVDNDLAAVMSVSFGACESQIGSAENSFYNNLWQQAASQGISVFVSSGDAGAAGCNWGGDTTGSAQGVNGLASTPYNIAVGGSQFNEGSGTYWNTSNGPGDVSVKSYIPEVAWNESGSISGGSNLWASGGGVSTIYPKPAWQAAPGVPSSNYRYVPDVALNAASHDAYLVQVQGALYTVGGTSAASPAFAGLMALIVQKTGQRQGNANVQFYQIGNAQYGSGGATVFHNIISGTNSVPGVTGFSCSTGYSPVTGLGSVDANALIGTVYLRTQHNLIPPGEPTGVTAISGDGQAIVSFIAPASNGGSLITSYTVTAYLGNGTVAATATGAASPITVTGLTDGVAYTFTVTATNAIGTGSASAHSDSVTPSQQSNASPVPALSPWGLIAAAGGLASILGFRRKYSF